MGEFPGVEQRLLHSGVPPEMAVVIAQEVPRSRDAFNASCGRFFIGMVIGIALAALTMPFVYLAALWLWGGVRPCGAGFLRSAHGVALLQFYPATFFAHLIVHVWLRTAHHKARMQFAAEHLLRLYFVGSMRSLIAKHPECATAEGYFRYIWRWWFTGGLGMTITAQAFILAVLFITPLTC